MQDPDLLSSLARSISGIMLDSYTSGSHQSQYTSSTYLQEFIATNNIYIRPIQSQTIAYINIPNHHSPPSCFHKQKIFQFVFIYPALLRLKQNYWMQVQPILEENPESLMESSALSYSGAIRKTERLTNKRNLFQQCQTILKKSYENRSPADNSVLLKLLQRNQLLKNLSDNISLDFVKGVLRNAKIEIIDEKQVIVEEDSDLDYMVIVLDGKLGIEKASFSIPTKTIESGKGKDTIEVSGLKTEELFEKLTIMAKKERDFQKSHSKLQRKSSFPVSNYDLHLPVLSQADYETFSTNIQKIVHANQEYGARQRLTSKTTKNRVAALQRTTLLVIEISFLFYWLQASFKVKLSKNIEQMKTIPCFQSIQEQKLSEIILSMKLCKKKRNDVVYQQGDLAENIFVLLEGEIKLIKKANLFKQNPNDFYVDRRKLVQQLNKEDNKYRSKSLKKNDDVLPFANFTTLYNYRPIKKSIEIGVISSFGLFGEEEIVFQTPRETTAVVDCLEVAYFEIDFKKILDIVGVKHADKFKRKLQLSISKKVLYRQGEFADHIGLQNKNNLDYFYMEEGKQKQSPRKVKLERINERMAPKTGRTDIGHAPAYYTSFNFNKMMTSKRYSDDSKQESRKIKKTQQYSKQSLFDVTLDSTEEKLVDFSHSWNPIEKKVKQEKLMSRRISPFKHEINIESPLIDQQYFRKIAKESQRLNKEFRTVKFALGKKAK